MAGLLYLDACIDVYHWSFDSLYQSLKGDFPRRYLPNLNKGTCENPESVVYWLRGEGFNIHSELYSQHSSDYYVVSGDLPAPYVNESPVFFLLQVLTRSLVKRGYVVMTDSVSIGLENKNVLILGFPHTGKSTISALAVDKGYKVYSTENTILRVDRDNMWIMGGSRVLVFDPRIRELYGVRIESTSKTRHGYEVLDLDLLGESASPSSGIPVDEIYIIYSSFNTRGFSKNPVKGRKIEKLIWTFSTSILKGMDYYQPRPLDMPLDEPVVQTLSRLLSVVKEQYTGRFHEVYGSAVEILEGISK